MSLNNNLEAIGTQAFYRCAIESVVVSPTVKKLEKEVFAACMCLRVAVLQEGLEEIGMGSFEKSGIEHVAIPKSLVVIEKWAFHKC